MSGPSFICLTNIPTPYRLFFFREMHERLEERYWKFEVWFMASSELERHWKFQNSDFSFPHRFLPGKSLRFSRNAFYWHPAFIRALREARPEILLVAGAWVYPTVWLAALSSASRRTIFWSESHLQSIRRAGLLTSLARRWILSQFSEFAVPGELARKYVQRYAAKARIFNLPNVVDPAIFHDQVRACRRVANKEPYPNRRVLLIVARLSEEKGLLPFLEGITKLGSADKEKLTLLIAGSGKLRPQIEHWSRTHDVDIRLLGEQSESQLTALYAQADGFALSSLSDPNPISVIEALWAGLPLLLSSRVGNHPECLQNGKNGFLFDLSKTESIATALSQWLALSPAELKNFGESSLHIAHTSFDPGQVVSTFLNELLEAREAHSERLLPSTTAVG